MRNEQQELDILEYIPKYWEKNGEGPRITDIVESLYKGQIETGRSLFGQYLKRMDKKKWIKLGRGQRDIKLLKKGRELLRELE